MPAATCRVILGGPMTERKQFDSLAIRGFRGLTDIDISGLGEVNIVLGANDVGKTSMLEAIFLIANPLEPRVPIKVQHGRSYPVQAVEDLASMFLDLDFSREVVIQVVLSGGGECRKLAISALDAGRQIGVDKEPLGKLESSGKRILQYNVESRPSIHDDPISFQIKLVDSGDNWVIERKPSDGIAIDSQTASFLVPTFAYEAARFGRLIVNKKDPLLVGHLRHINPRVTKISVIGDVAYLDIGLSQLMPLNMFGSGMIRAAKILSECISRDVNILLIDEFEQGLHYQAISFLLETVLRLSKEHGVQVFATTHSIEVIRGLQQVLGKKECSEFRPTTKCVTLQRDKDGVVRAYRYDYQQFDHCIEHGIEIR